MAERIVDVKPARGRVIVKREQATETIGNTSLVKSQQQVYEESRYNDTAYVVRIGDGPVDDDGQPIPLWFKVGDKVLISPAIGRHFKVNEEEYDVLPFDGILLVFVTEEVPDLILPDEGSRIIAPY